MYIIFDQYWETSIKGGERQRRGRKEKALCVTRTTAEELETLKCNHEEADTGLLIHAKYSTHPRSRIIIQSPDTDMLVLCVTQFDEIPCEELWFSTGVKDRLRYIPVHAVSEKLRQKLCKSLPAFHALTGCDTTSSLTGVGKKKAWEALCRSEAQQESLALVRQSAVLDDETSLKCEEFICTLYPAVKKKTKSADELRYVMFCQKRHKSELLPPTSDSLQQHTLDGLTTRQALTAIQELPTPEENDWEKN